VSISWTNKGLSTINMHGATTKITMKFKENSVVRLSVCNL